MRAGPPPPFDPPPTPNADDQRTHAQTTLSLSLSQKQSRAAYAAAVAAAAAVADAPPADQAAWLWGAYADRLSLSRVETAGLGAAAMLPLPPPGPLAERLRAAAPDVAAAAVDGRGPLRILALSPSANAALALGRALAGPPSSPSSALRPAKLFARHMKAADQAAALAADRPASAAGTPGRVAALADSGALDLCGLQLLIIDTARDAKARTLMTLPETAGDAAGILKRHVAARVAAGECRVALYDSAGGGVAAGKKDARRAWRGRGRGK